MNYRIVTMRTILAVFAAWLWATPLTAHAHDGDPRVEISPDHLSPGLVLEVRGVNIAPEESITVSLVGPAGEFPLGTVTGDEHGDFTQAFTVPVDLPEGIYKVLTRGASQLVVSAPLTIIGPAVHSNEEGGQREQEEPLLATLPPDWGQTQAQSTRPIAPAPTPVRANVEPAPAENSAPSFLPLAVILGTLFLAGFSVALAARRRTEKVR